MRNEKEADVLSEASGQVTQTGQVCEFTLWRHFMQFLRLPEQKGDSKKRRNLRQGIINKETTKTTHTVKLFSLPSRALLYESLSVQSEEHPEMRFFNAPDHGSNLRKGISDSV